MSKFARIATATALSTVILTLWAGCSLLDHNYKRELLPQKLRTGWFYANGTCAYSNFLSSQSAWAFSLTDDTIAAIELEQLGFFADINEPQNAPRRRYFVGEWKATPVQHDYPAETGGLPGNLQCGLRSWFWPKGIKEELLRPGNYYQESGARGIYVLPRLGVVVASGSDR